RCIAEEPEGQREIRRVVRQDLQKVTGKLDIPRLVTDKAELTSQSCVEASFETLRKTTKDVLRLGDGLVRIGIDQGQERLGEAGKGPVCDAGLVCIWIL